MQPASDATAISNTVRFICSPWSESVLESLHPPAVARAPTTAVPTDAPGPELTGDPCRDFSSAMPPALRLLAAPLALLAALACSPRRIPGTDVRDTPDTRAVIAVIDSYRKAAERRDAGAVLALVSPKYFDDAGTPDPGDDVDYDQLGKRLAADYARVTSLRLDIGVKQVEIDNDTAFAIIFYDQHYRIETKAGEVAKQASDPHRMRFVREQGAWRFISGL